MKLLSRSLFGFALFFALALFAAPSQAQGRVTSGSFETGGAKIAYRVQGSGPVMMLVHGYPLSGELFAENRASLARFYKIVTPDLRGFGDSTAPNDDKGSVSTYARDMLALMDHLGVQKAIVGGMSMGGPVMLEMYRQAPQRFRGLILIDTTAAPANYVEKAQWPGFGKQAAEKGVASMVPILLPQMLTGRSRTTRPDLVDRLGFIVKKGSVNGAEGGGYALANRPDFQPLLPQIKVPTLIVVGLDDPIYAVASQKKMHAAIKGSKLVVIPGAAHAAIIEQAAAANRSILTWAKTVR